eukprot:tig00000144_g9026.t1
MMRPWIRFVVAALALAVLASVADAHGFLASPPARARLGWEKEFASCPGIRRHYCFHCLQGGGPRKVYASPSDWPSNGKHGVCGSGQIGDSPDDYVGGGPWGYRGVLAADYASGSVATFKVALTTYHGGYFEFSLCSMDGAPVGADATEQCLATHVLKCVGSPYCHQSRFYVTEAGASAGAPRGV